MPEIRNIENKWVLPPAIPGVDLLVEWGGSNCESGCFRWLCAEAHIKMGGVNLFCVILMIFLLYSVGCWFDSHKVSNIFPKTAY